MQRQSVILRLLTLITLGAGLSAIAQNAEQEMNELKQHLSGAAGLEITVASNQSAALPKKNLNVFLGMGLDTVLREHFVRWIADWNKNEGRRHAALEIVSQINDADVVLARYVKTDRVSVSTQSGTYVLYNTTTHKMEEHRYAPEESVLTAPEYNYIL